jgi:hypothetical protein
MLDEKPRRDDTMEDIRDTLPLSESDANRCTGRLRIFRGTQKQRKKRRGVRIFFIKSHVIL